MFKLSAEYIRKLETKIDSKANSIYFYAPFCIACFFVALLEGLFITQSGQNMSPVALSYILSGGRFYSSGLADFSQLCTNLPPLYSIFISAFMHLGLTAVDSARMITVSFFSLSIFPIFFIGRSISGNFTAYLACLVSLVFTPFLYITSYAWAETMYMFSSLMAILLVEIFRQKNKYYILYISGIFITLAMLSRYNGVILFLVCLITLSIMAMPLKNYWYNVFIFSCISLLPTFIYYFVKTFVIGRNTLSTFVFNNEIIANELIKNIDLIIRLILRSFLKISLTSENGFYLAAIILIFCILLSILNNTLYRYIKNNLICILYICVYIISLIILNSVFVFDPMNDRYVSPIYPFIILTSISFIYINFNQIKNPSLKTGTLLAISILLIIFFIIQINSSFGFYQQTKSNLDSEQLGMDRLNSYILRYNITSNDIIYIDGTQYSYPKLFLLSRERNPNIKLGYIMKASPNGSILGNITVLPGTEPASARSLADLIRANKNHSIYLIAPFEVAQNYMVQPYKDICFINPVKFSKSFICRVDLKNNGTCDINPFPRDYIIDNGSSIKAAVAGNFIGQKHDQLFILKSNPSSTKENILQILDFTKGTPAKVEYEDEPRAAWLAANHSLLSGDFMGLGYDQAFHLDGDKIIIEDFSQGKAPAIIRYSEAPANNSALGKLVEADELLAGDFLARGHSQILFMDRKETKLVIADFSKGKTPETTEITGIEGNSTLLGLMMDEGDRRYAGDFMGLGQSQLLMINCNHTGAKEPKIIIADFEKGPVLARYQEKWEESRLFGGWLDANDTQLVGDFMELGHSQVLFVNHNPSGGKIMIIDFSQGKIAGKYWESWNQGSIFQGWLNINDTRIVGDFKELGYSQVLFLNRSVNGLNATIVEFINGKPQIAF